MDNDNKIVKKVKGFVKKIKFEIDYRDINILPEHEGNNLIQDLITKQDPLMIARGGATEMRCISEYLNGKKFSKKTSDEIFMLSGVFPNDEATLIRFCEYYIQSISHADLISLWGVGAEARVVHQNCKNAIFTELHALEPYYFDTPWSSSLEGKRVLVVHPFVDSIMHQYNNREKIFPDKNILPNFDSLVCIKAVQSIAGQKTEFPTWFDALDYMKHEIDKLDFEIAIIGAGAYGLPLAAYCKEIGKKAIQMSGATQILFGIKGNRWDNHPIISKQYNEAWIRPNDEETPQQNKKVEGGSYW